MKSVSVDCSSFTSIEEAVSKVANEQIQTLGYFVVGITGPLRIGEIRTDCSWLEGAQCVVWSTATREEYMDQQKVMLKYLPPEHCLDHFMLAAMTHFYKMKAE